MVKAAVDFKYGNRSFKEGDAIPSELVSELEEHQYALLDNFVQVQGGWHKINDPLVKGWVESRKSLEKRLRDHFKIKDKKEKAEVGD